MFWLRVLMTVLVAAPCTFANPTVGLLSPQSSPSRVNSLKLRKPSIDAGKPADLQRRPQQQAAVDDNPENRESQELVRWVTQQDPLIRMRVFLPFYHQRCFRRLWRTWGPEIVESTLQNELRKFGEGGSASEQADRHLRVHGQMRRDQRSKRVSSRSTNSFWDDKLGNNDAEPCTDSAKSSKQRQTCLDCLPGSKQRRCRQRDDLQALDQHQTRYEDQELLERRRDSDAHLKRLHGQDLAGWVRGTVWKEAQTRMTAFDARPTIEVERIVKAIPAHKAETGSGQSSSSAHVLLDQFLLVYAARRAPALVNKAIGETEVRPRMDMYKLMPVAPVWSDPEWTMTMESGRKRGPFLHI